jgi:hypothetical protein
MITYSSNKVISSSEFIDVLKRSTLAERRPVNDPERIQAMLDNANVINLWVFQEPFPMVLFALIYRIWRLTLLVKKVGLVKNSLNSRMK